MYFHMSAKIWYWENEMCVEPDKRNASMENKDVCQFFSQCIYVYHNTCMRYTFETKIWEILM